MCKISRHLNNPTLCLLNTNNNIASRNYLGGALNRNIEVIDIAR